MRITMLKKLPGSRNGILVELFEQGETYDLPEKLAMTFISIGAAEEATRVRRGMGDAPENKVAEPIRVPAPEVETEPEVEPDANEKKKDDKKKKPARRKY